MTATIQQNFSSLFQASTWTNSVPAEKMLAATMRRDSAISMDGANKAPPALPVFGFAACDPRAHAGSFVFAAKPPVCDTVLKRGSLTNIEAQPSPDRPAKQQKTAPSAPKPRRRAAMPSARERRNLAQLNVELFYAWRPIGKRTAAHTAPVGVPPIA